jgi:uncharacterized protein YdaU (DUF1376 family)
MMDQASFGIYTKLLLWQWEQTRCKLPDDIDALCAMCGIHTKTDRKKLGLILDSEFRRQRNRVWHTKMLHEFELKLSRHRRAVADGSTGGRPKKRGSKKQVVSKRKAGALRSVNLPHPHPHPHPHSLEESEILLATDSDTPEWLINLPITKQRRLLDAATAKQLDLTEVAIQCDEWWASRAGKPTARPRWYSRLSNWLEKADSRSGTIKFQSDSNEFTVEELRTIERTLRDQPGASRTWAEEIIRESRKK